MVTANRLSYTAGKQTSIWWEEFASISSFYFHVNKREQTDTIAKLCAVYVTDTYDST